MLFVTVILWPALFTSGCATVQPWERGRLASRIMQPEACPLGAVQRQHAFSVREGAGLAMGSTGAGCGCN